MLPHTCVTATNLRRLEDEKITGHHHQSVRCVTSVMYEKTLESPSPAHLGNVKETDLSNTP